MENCLKTRQNNIYKIAQKAFRYLWESATFTTWGNYLARFFTWILIIPLVLTRFSTEEVAVWFLFATIVNLGNLADLGFSPTFIRLTAYVMAGATSLNDFRDSAKNRGSGETNWRLMEDLYANIKLVYVILCIIALLLLGIGGTLALKKQISTIPNNDLIWIAWAVICFSTIISFYGRVYNNLLQGMNFVALVNRWNAILGILSILSSFFVLLLNGGILGLVIAIQFWKIMEVLRNYIFLMRVAEKRFVAYKGMRYNQNVFAATWSPVWRTAIGITGSTGVVQASGVIYAQFSDAASLASYLLALRLMTQVSLFSQAPFYSKIPIFCRLRAEGKLKELAISTGKAMRNALLVFLLGTSVIGFGADLILKVIHSNAGFITPQMWSFMVFVWLLERHHAMHAQIYGTTNHIPFYIPICISGLFNLALSIVLVGKYGIWAFLWAHFISNAMINNWWNVKISLKSIKVKFFTWVKEYLILPVLCSILLFIIQISMFY